MACAGCISFSKSAKAVGVDVKMFRYSAFGLDIASEFPIKDLFTDQESPRLGKPEVTVRLEAITGLPAPTARLRSWVIGNAAGFICDVPSGSRFQVSSTGRVSVELRHNTCMPGVSDYLAGYGLPSYLHYTDAFPMHVSVVETPSGCWAFAGDSGAGKSTTAALVSQMTGWRLLCDDVCAVRSIDGTIQVSFGFNRIKVWEDSARLLRLDTSRLSRDPARPDKFVAPIQDFNASNPGALRGIVFLEWASTDAAPNYIEIAKPSSSNAFARIMNSIHSSYFCAILKREGDAAKMSAALIAYSEVWAVKRAKGPGPVEKIISSIENHAARETKSASRS